MEKKNFLILQPSKHSHPFTNSAPNPMDAHCQGISTNNLKAFPMRNLPTSYGVEVDVSQQGRMHCYFVISLPVTNTTVYSKTHFPSYPSYKFKCAKMRGGCVFNSPWNESYSFNMLTFMELSCANIFSSEAAFLSKLVTRLPIVPVCNE